MYFTVANDTGFDLEGRLHCAAITQYICAEHNICRKEQAFEGATCRDGMPFDAATMRIEKKDGRVILIEVYEEREENQGIQDVKADGSVVRKGRHRIDDDPEEENAAFGVAVPSPYPNNEEFLRCARCNNYYKITEESIRHHAKAICEHVLGAKPLGNRVKEAGSDGDVAVALVLDEMLSESNGCTLCPPDREIRSISWCPLEHAPGGPEAALNGATTIMWVRRDR